MRAFLYSYINSTAFLKYELDITTLFLVETFNEVEINFPIGKRICSCRRCLFVLTLRLLVMATQGPNYTHKFNNDGIFAQSSKMTTVTKGFDARLAKRPFFLVFDFRALGRLVSQPRIGGIPELEVV